MGERQRKNLKATFLKLQAIHCFCLCPQLECTWEGPSCPYSRFVSSVGRWAGSANFPRFSRLSLLLPLSASQLSILINHSEVCFRKVFRGNWEYRLLGLLCEGSAVQISGKVVCLFPFPRATPVRVSQSIITLPSLAEIPVKQSSGICWKPGVLISS